MSLTARIREDGKLEMIADNGDQTKIKEALERWNFKDEQAFLRFTVSLLLLTEDKEIWIKENGLVTQITPAKHSIKE